MVQPYINAETSEVEFFPFHVQINLMTLRIDGGGFPGWLTNVSGTARTNDTSYTEAWLPWITAVSKLVAPYQVSLLSSLNYPF